MTYQRSNNKQIVEPRTLDESKPNPQPDRNEQSSQTGEDRRDDQDCHIQRGSFRSDVDNAIESGMIIDNDRQ